VPVTAVALRRRWLSRRALWLHAAVVVALPLCGVAARWQLDRALGGNNLSWFYVFEWPAFAALSVWLWWTLLHAPEPVPASEAEPDRGPPAETVLDRRRIAPRWDPESESDRLRAYNAFLGALAEVDQQRASR
jgi:hypothetical protein